MTLSYLAEAAGEPFGRLDVLVSNAWPRAGLPHGRFKIVLRSALAVPGLRREVVVSSLPVTWARDVHCW